MRKKRVHTKHYAADGQFGRIDVARLTNYLMRDGKKSVAERVVADAFAKIKEESKQDPVQIFEKAMENAMPVVEVASKRVGGANYQVPREVRPERRFILGLRWIITAARAKKGKPMATKLAEELIAAAKNEGSAIKKKQDTHRMAEANRAFAHFVR